VAGQRKIRELWKHQVEQQRKAERLRNRKENAEFETEGVNNTAQYNENEQYEQQMIIKSNTIFVYLLSYETYKIMKII